MPKIRLAPWQHLALTSPFKHFCLYGGVGTGKTYTLAQFGIKNIRENPDTWGFIGANTYDQLSQVTLMELFYWFAEYKMEYVVDRRPPPAWPDIGKLKDYHNTIHAFQPNKKKVTRIFTRVLSGADKLRGLEFGWYGLDETRDTEEYAHDMILGRMRQGDIKKGLIVTTTNGEDWTHKRFVKNNYGDGLFGSIHVPTLASVKANIVTQEYYDSMRRSYSPLMAEQELDAKHVNILGGQAYYAFGPYNRRSVAPWGDSRPDRRRPLIVGCDFNYQPAPHTWIVGQRGPGQWSDHIHWFRELSGVGISSREMAFRLISQFPQFFYQLFGDASGTMETTSNASETDYKQIGEVLSEHGSTYSVNVERGNPRIRDRVENMNAMARNAMGETRMTYDPQGCPLFDADVRSVGWRESRTFRAKLDDGGDKQRTHASDAAGYAVYKLFPPAGRSVMIPSIPSGVRSEHGLT